MTKSERNNAFSKMLKEFPKVFGRISFRERLMLGVAFDYAITETHDLENKLLGERCNQLLKDKVNLTDELQKLKETLAQTVENDEVAYETLKLHDQEEIGMLNSKVEELEQQIEKMKNGDNCKYGCMACGNYICDLGQDNCNTIPFHCDKWELED